VSAPQDRTNSRNGYRHRDFDTRADTLDVAIPKLRRVFPGLAAAAPQPRREGADLGGCTCYLLGVSTRRMEKLVDSLGITSLSKSQVSVMPKDLDAQVEAFRSRPLDAGPHTFVAADALCSKVRENGRVVNVHTLVAVGVSAEGYWEILGIEVTSSEDGAGWLAFLPLPDRPRTDRRQAGNPRRPRRPRVGDRCHPARAAGAAWQRCRTHTRPTSYPRPRRIDGRGFKTLPHSVYDQPDADRFAPIMIE